MTRVARMGRQPRDSEETEHVAHDLESWVRVLDGLLRLPDGARAEVREEITSHIRERVRDLMLGGASQASALHTSLEELGSLAHLARRLNHAHHTRRRRLVMNGAMLLLGASAVGLTAVQFAPSRAPMTAIFEDRAQETQLDWAQSKIDVNFEGEPLASVLAWFDGLVPALVTADQTALSSRGVDPDQIIFLKLQKVSIEQAMNRVAAQIAEASGVTMAWSRIGETVELLPASEAAHADRVFVRFDVSAILELNHQSLGVSPEDTMVQIQELIRAFVSPDLWVDNGGDAAKMMGVSTHIFIEAPRSMLQRIEWILAQLAEGREIARDMPADS